ncbi:MAG: cytochrome-c peroxidase, partial [Bacteroidota bacterium]|nr:cytochrome-c peroxidase [Bacteroidota bacterium]
MQVLVPIQEHAEFDFNILEIAERMKEDTTYVMASRIAYERDPDPFVITRAISCFERTLVSGQSRYDQYLAGDLFVLNATELHGEQLFLSDRLSCAKCHSGFNFTDYRFDNNGLYESYQDQGRYRLTGIDADRALFKIPTLRNLSVTGPYMHDGSLPDLPAVIEHYNSGGKNHPHKSILVRPLHLTIEEKKALLSFLNSLTDENFIYNQVFRP